MDQSRRPVRRAVVAVGPLRDFYTTPHRLSSLGARCAAQILVNMGIETHFCDFQSRSARGVRETAPAEMAYLTPYLIAGETGPVSFFTRYQRFGPPIATCADEICGLLPDIVLISCWAFCYASAALELAQEVKRRLVHAPVIVGGAGVSAYPAFFARHDGIDIACAGEAEAVLPQVVRALRQGAALSGIPGVWQKCNGTVQGAPVARHAPADEMEAIFAVARCRRFGMRITASLSRGCPRRCRFCSIAISHGSEFRVTPLSKVEEAVRGLPEAHVGENVSVNLEDDNLLCNPQYLFSAIDIFRRRYGSIALYLENGVDYRLCDPAMVERLADCGLAQLNISLGAATIAAAARERRPLDVARYEGIVRTALRKKMPCVTYFICGLEGDTPAAAAQTLAYLCGQPTRVGISLFYPVPGLEGFEDRRRFDQTAPALASGAAAYPWTGALDTRALVTAFRLARYVNACKNPQSDPRFAGLLARIARERRLYTLVRRGGAMRETVVETANEEMVATFFAAAYGPGGEEMPKGLAFAS